MLGNAGVYAVKRRKKPAQKNSQPLPAKTNPSKRHRDRLNVELDRLTGLLPFSEEVRGRLDKLSVLRLSVGYLKVKSYLHAALQNATCSPPPRRNGAAVSLDGVSFSEGELLLQSLNGFVLVMTTDGTIFYTSPTIQDFLGFHQSDVVHQSVYDLVHVDDRRTLSCQLQLDLETDLDVAAEDVRWSRKASSSSHNSFSRERSFCCRLRCLLDNTSGFMALHFTGYLKELRLQEMPGGDGTPHAALFAIATPLQPPSVMEIRTKTLMFQTKHRMDFAPMGIDTRGKLMLGYSETELITPGSGYQFLHAADMMYCADNHMKMIKTGDSGFTFFRLLTKTGRWLWVQASARIVFKGGTPDFIVARQKALTDEEGEEHLRQRRQQLPFNLATGEGVLYDISLGGFSIPGPPGQEDPSAERPLDPASLLGCIHRQDHSVYAPPQKPHPHLVTAAQAGDPEYERAFLDSHALLSVPSQEERPNAGDVTSQAMMDSLEQILGGIGDGGLEGLGVEEAELREWQNTLAWVSKEKEELNRVLANDVFSYVEEALMRESGGCTAAQSESHVYDVFSGLSVEDPHPLFSSSELGRECLGGSSAELRNASEVVFPTAVPPPLCPGHNPTPGSPVRSPRHRGNQTQPCNHVKFCPNPEQRQQDAFNHSHRGPQPEPAAQPSERTVWQQQPQSFHHHTHSSHTLGGVNPKAGSPQMQRLSGSCMYDKRHRAASAAAHNGLAGPHAFVLPQPVGGLWPADPDHDPSPAPGAHTAELGHHHSGENWRPATECPLENGAFFCWNAEPQISRVPLCSDPFAFPALPTGSVNLSQNTGP